MNPWEVTEYEPLWGGVGPTEEEEAYQEELIDRRQEEAYRERKEKIQNDNFRKKQ